MKFRDGRQNLNMARDTRLCYNETMSKILIIGNVLKDVYLKLDDKQGEFEVDEQGISWLELGFNGEGHKFFRRTSTYGGAATTLLTLNRLGMDAGILNAKTELKAGEIIWSGDPSGYRYILSHRGGITYFVPSERKPTDWAMPNGTPEWILVDRSTTVSMRLVDELKNFIKFSNGTKLAVHAEKETTPAGQRLMEMADVLFVEDEPPVHRDEKIVDKIELDKPNTQLVCHITPRRIVFGEAEESWSLSRVDMMTHLTIYSIIVATILGVIAAGGAPADALLLAKLNAEHATLDGSLSTDKLKELAEAELAKRTNLKLIARSLMTPSKGILAIDESSKSLAKRLEKFGIKNTAENRDELYRMMIETPGIKNTLSGVILSEANMQVKMTNGQSLLEFVTDKGIIPGMKVDLGTALMERSEDTHTLGLENLAERLRKYYENGLRFAKWRAMFKIGKEQPGFFAVQKNAEELASFAKESQMAGLVPVVEVDVVEDGDYTTEQNADVMVRILNEVFARLNERRVELAGCILKCNMVRNGRKAEEEATPEQIGMATAAILRHVVPRYLAGIVLLSGGQDPKMATKSLTAVMQNSPFPWPVSFAFSRAFEEPVLATWKGKPENIKAAQAAFTRHLLANADALHYGRIEGTNGGQRAQSIGVLDWA